MVLSWIIGVIVGLVIGAIAHLVAGLGKSRPLGLSLAVGLVGAVVGRLLLGSAALWHPHFVGAVIGAAVLSTIWVAVARVRQSS